MEVIGLYALANAERLEHVPALVDVAHQADVGSYGFADAADALDLYFGDGAAGQRELRFHGGPATLGEPAGSGDDLVERQRAHQGAAGVCGRAIAEAAEQLGDRHAKDLATDVP